MGRPEGKAKDWIKINRIALKEIYLREKIKIGSKIRRPLP